MALLISERRVGETTVIVPSGEIDIASSQHLADKITAALHDERTSGLIVDLSDTRFLGSSGLRVLLHGRRLADGRAKPYRVTGASPFVRQVLQYAGLWEFLTGEGT